MQHYDIHLDSDYKHRLSAAISECYAVSVRELEPAKRGYYGETWKVRGESGVYFLKVDYLRFHQQRFRGSLAAIDYLCSSGIDFVGEIVKTRDGRLFAEFDGAIMGMFVWVDGENVETGDTKPLEYQLLCRIYNKTRPGLAIPTAEFSDAAAVRFYELLEKLKKAPRTDANDRALSCFSRYSDMLNLYASRLDRAARRCSEDNGQFYLTHGDAGGNFFCAGGKNYIFDWDEVMYSPIDRDAWVMCCYDWARSLLNKTLRENNISYQLRPERLAFFCYHMLFFYLCEFLNVHAICDKSDGIIDFFANGWINERLQFADTFKY